MLSMEWLEKAACTEEDPELFFPVGTAGPAARDTAAAKEVCAQCEVRVQCLAWALKAGESGVWGGTCAEERADLRRKAQWSHAVRSARSARSDGSSRSSRPDRSSRSSRPDPSSRSARSARSAAT